MPSGAPLVERSGCTLTTMTPPRRARIMVSLLAALALPPITAAAQPAGKVPRVGLLASTTCSPKDPMFQALVAGLRAHHYEDGKTVTVVGCEAERRPERYLTLAANLVRARVDVIVATTWDGVTAAREVTSTIPIVMAVVADPVALGFVESLERPGRNVTGVACPLGALLRHQIELLKEALPSVSRLAVLINPANPAHSRWTEGTLPAQRMGVVLQPVGVRVPADLDAAIGIVSQTADALLVLEDPLFFTQRQRIGALVTAAKLPAMYTVPEQIDAGGLIAYGPALRLIAQRAAAFVDRILRGARPADLAVELPRKFELAVNLRTAKLLGFSIPRSVLERADQVVD
jgi:ABC-type uncharacterized transport system substrate-binding protein